MPISLETRLDDVEFVAFDTETTGCTAATGRMVEIGAVRFRRDGAEIDRFQTLINPLCMIPWTVTRIHGITDEMVRDCPTESGILPAFLSFLGEPSTTILLAHNAGFDMAFVGNALGRCGIAPPQHSILDTVRLSRRRAPELPSHSLRSIVRSFGLGTTTDHRGLSDSVHLMQIFQRLVARPPAVETVGELFQLVRPGQFQSYTEPFKRRVSRPTLGRGWWRASSLAASSPGDLDPISHANDSPASVPCTVIPAPDSSVHDIPPPHRRDVTATEISAVIASGRSVSVVYDGGRNAGQRRAITPVKLVTAVEATYLFAYCHLDRKQKQFRLDRIREIILD